MDFNKMMSGCSQYEFDVVAMLPKKDVVSSNPEKVIQESWNWFKDQHFLVDMKFSVDRMSGKDCNGNFICHFMNMGYEKDFIKLLMK